MSETVFHPPMTVNGRDVITSDSMDVYNPSTRALVGRAPIGDDAVLEDAVDAARKAFPAWAQRPDEERQAACRALADEIAAHSEELAQILTREQGKPLNGMGSRFELGGAVAWMRHTADLTLPVKLLQDDEQGRIELHRKPIGVVGSITPWNWPAMIAVWHIGPAIRAGNAVVIKPSHLTPLSTLRLVQILARKLPPGVLNCVTGPNELGAKLASHEHVGKIIFTGSTATGRKIMSGAAQTLKRLTLELGGNDAAIVVPDCNPEEIAESVFWGAFINNGQTCAALKRLYVHDAIYDRMCEALAQYAKTVAVGDGLNEANLLGPLQNKAQFDKISALVADARERGGRILTGGAPMSGAGYFYPPTLVADLDAAAALVYEEQFGPALPILRYRDVEEAVALANDNPNGLGGSVWSTDRALARKIGMRLECGSVWVNKHGAIQPNAPFGGVKSSGVGVEFGEEGLAECATLQTVFC